MFSAVLRAFKQEYIYQSIFLDFKIPTAELLDPSPGKQAAPPAQGSTIYQSALQRHHRRVQPTMAAVIDKPEVVADELAIRSLVARFANSCSPPDYDAFSKLWVPAQVRKPTWTLTKPFEMAATGIDEISQMLHQLLSTREFFVQLVHSGVVDVDGDNASGRWILREVARGPGETYYNNFAIYEDRYVKSEGKWYFERRDYKYMFLDSSPFQGDSFSLAPS